uniref:Ribosomal protein S3 n=1 Tax=Babesia sp. Dunhuang TaxID=1164853 RepID=A0A411AD43_9APIC|nr:ribosomal protein S3 [Babesia sp. Xinjiang]QAX26968.1 ribosomal protein S3 [Babesia sp. Xinjiang]QAX26999.1 ribosomal protein S3 [Babesia sp. Dunhuang]
MTKSISPILFRQNLFFNSINKVHIKLYKNFNSLNYFKFFQLILNIIYIYKLKLKNTIKIANKFLYITCDYIDFYNICININFYNILKNKIKLLYSYNNICNLNIYINYFIKYNLYNNKLFVWAFIKCLKNINNNKFYIIKQIKHYILKNTKPYIKILNFCNKLVKNYKSNKRMFSLHSIKVKYSGCINRGGSKKKIFSYTKGNIPISSISCNIDYINDLVQTYKGVIGIKCWLVFK